MLKELEKNETELKVRMEKIQGNKNVPACLAVDLYNELPPVVQCCGGLYMYNGKCYDLLSDDDMDKLFLAFCLRYHIPASFKHVSMVARAFRAYEKVKDVMKMNDYDGLINLNNGILNIYTREVLPHSHNYSFDSVINIDY